MPGKMTVLDRLIKEGRINKSPFREMKLHGESTDPMFNARANQVMSIPKGITLDPSWPTPERVKYQKGIEARMQPKYLKADENVNETYENMDAFKDEWNEAVEKAKEDMLSDWQDELENAATDEIINDYDVAQDRYFSARDERNYLRTPAAWMQEQTMTPRYRNYQRLMQQRAANMAMGRDLSRRYAIAYNNLLRRGLTPAEARMYMREYFGGR